MQPTLIKLRRNVTETLEMYEIYFGDQTVGKGQVFERFSKIKNGVTSAKNSECLGCTSTRKADGRVDGMTNLSAKTETSLSMKMPTCW